MCDRFVMNFQILNFRWYCSPTMWTIGPQLKKERKTERKTERKNMDKII